MRFAIRVVSGKCVDFGNINLNQLNKLVGDKTIEEAIKFLKGVYNEKH